MPTTWPELKLQASRYWAAFHSLREEQVLLLQQHENFQLLDDDLDDEEERTSEQDIAEAEVNVQMQLWVVLEEQRLLRHLLHNFVQSPRSFIILNSETDINAAYVCVRRAMDLILYVGARRGMHRSVVDLLNATFAARFGINWDQHQLYVLRRVNNFVEINVADENQCVQRGFIRPGDGNYPGGGGDAGEEDGEEEEEDMYMDLP